MEKYYLCSVQSKKNPNENETVLVLAEDVFEFVTSCVHSDSVVIISTCSTFNDNDKDNADEK